MIVVLEHWGASSNIEYDSAASKQAVAKFSREIWIWWQYQAGLDSIIYARIEV